MTDEQRSSAARVGGIKRPARGENPNSIAALVRAYNKSFDGDIARRVGDAIDNCDPSCITLDDWSKAIDYCDDTGDSVRAEILTRKFIQRQKPDSPEPYLRLASLLISIKQYDGESLVAPPVLEKLAADPKQRWKVVRTLIAADCNENALRVIRSHLGENPDDFPFIIAECRILLNSGKIRLARRIFRLAKQLSGSDLEKWAWISSVAGEFEDVASMKAAGARVLELIAGNPERVTKPVMRALLRAGNFDHCRGLLRVMVPEEKIAVPTARFFFDTAWSLGVQEAILRFGDHLMQVAPTADTEIKLQSLKRNRAFALGGDAAR